MSTTQLVVGASLPFPWPKINGIFTTNQSEWMAELIMTNEEYYVAEKIHGQNMCVSTDGWIASRNQIIALKTDNLATKKSQGVSLKGMKDVFEKLDILKKKIDVSLPEECHQLLAYGEFVLNGTASSPYDIYNYKEKEYVPGEFYIFAIALVLKEPLVLGMVETLNMKKAMKHVFNNAKSTALIDTMNGTLFSSYMNPKNVGIIEKVGLQSVKFIYKDYLQSILTNPKILRHLQLRLTEGFVLSNANTMIKFKYIENVSMPYMDKHLMRMEYYLDTFAVNYAIKEKNVMESLRKLVENDAKWINIYRTSVWKKFLKEEVPKYPFEPVSFCSCHSCEEDLNRKMNYWIFRVYAEFFNKITTETCPFVDLKVEMDIKSKLENYFLTHTTMTKNTFAQKLETVEEKMEKQQEKQQLAVKNE